MALPLLIRFFGTSSDGDDVMDQTFTYILPASLLYQAVRLLRPAEKACFVSGLRMLPNVIVLTQLLPVHTGSHTHVDFPAVDILRYQLRLQSMGQDIEAQFHSHPGAGENSTYHSCVDDATARRWENGAPFVGAIFSDCGKFVRFFNYEQRSTIHVYGHVGITNDPSLFQLSEIHQDSLQAEDGQPGGLAVDAQAGAASVVEAGDDHESEDSSRRRRRSRK